MQEENVENNPRQTEAHSTATTSGTAADNSREKAFNRSALLARIGGHEEMIPRFVGMFLESVEDCLPKLKQAILEEDMEAVKKVAHTLKGVSGNIGADRMHTVVLKIRERAANATMEDLRDLWDTLVDEFELFRTEAATGQ
jgi:HPt (histidine-containing phosphotransfer) domain-containing protein